MSEMKRFNSNTVRPLGNLQLFTEKQKAAARRANGVKSRWALDAAQPKDVKRFRDQLAPMKPDFVSPRKRRGMSGCKLSPEKRAMVHDRLKLREAFLRSV